MPTFFEARFKPLLTAILLVQLGLQITSIRRESQTYDEAAHLAAGYQYWKTGQFRFNAEHPPLVKLLSAIPLVGLEPPLPIWTPNEDLFAFGERAIYQSGHPGPDLIQAGRWASIALTSCLLLAVALITKRWAGHGAGLTVAALCALDPHLLAHGRYVTTDLGASLFYFLTTALWIGYLSGRNSWLPAGIAAGLGLGTKFSLIILPGILGLLALVAVGLSKDRWPALRRHLQAGAGAALVAAAVLLLLYAPESWRTFRGRLRDSNAAVPAGQMKPAHSYYTGLYHVLTHDSDGHDAYLLGEISHTGWWYYFPVAIAVKSTLTLLLLLFGAMAAACWKFGAALSRVRAWRLPRSDGPALFWIGLILALSVFLGLAMHSRLNIGLRHVLPAFPLLYVLSVAYLATVLPRKWATVAALCAVSLQAAESLSVYPNFLGFFNAAAGGTDGGPRYLIDSNLDWGQDLPKLREYLVSEGSPPLCLEYFGTANLAAYGIPKPQYLPRTYEIELRQKVDCLGVISVTLLYELYREPGDYTWLRERKPIARLGSSLQVFDLRRPARPSSQ